MASVNLIWSTPNGSSLLAYIARVSNPDNQHNPDFAKLLQYLVKHKHWSPFEMVGLCVEINTTRDIGRQILRHRSFHFQEFCVAGDTEVTLVSDCGKTTKRSIETLYRYQSDPRMQVVWDRGVRVYDEKSRTFVRSRIKEVFKTGMKECFKVTLEDGKQITCTGQHRFFTRDGFAQLSDLAVGRIVAVNGEPCYKSLDWMTRAKQESLVAGGGVQAIADAAGMSYHTIRKWLKIHGLQFTKKENAIVLGDVWNKGLPKELQPKFGKPHSAETRAKMEASSRKGAESNLFVNGSSENLPFRRKVWAWQSKHKYALMTKYGNACAKCGSSEKLEIDHVIPVSADETLAFELSNLQILCASCHREKSVRERVAARQTVRWKRIVSIEPAGEMMTYDLEVEHESHNYVANGIVTHNSGRYQTYGKLPTAELRECRLQDDKNRQNSLDTDDGELIDWWARAQRRVTEDAQFVYEMALKKGVAKEQARAILPEGLTPSRMYMHGTLRDWIHYIQVRTDPSTQKEHRLIAEQCKAIVIQEYPELKDALNG